MAIQAPRMQPFPGLTSGTNNLQIYVSGSQIQKAELMRQCLQASLLSGQDWQHSAWIFRMKHTHKIQSKTAKVFSTVQFHIDFPGSELQ